MFGRTLAVTVEGAIAAALERGLGYGLARLIPVRHRKARRATRAHCQESEERRTGVAWRGRRPDGETDEAAPGGWPRDKTSKATAARKRK